MGKLINALNAQAADKTITDDKAVTPNIELGVGEYFALGTGIPGNERLVDLGVRYDMAYDEYVSEAQDFKDLLLSGNEYPDTYTVFLAVVAKNGEIVRKLFETDGKREDDRVMTNWRELGKDDPSLRGGEAEVGDELIKPEKEEAPVSNVIRFKDGTVVKIIDSEGKPMSTIIRTARKVVRDFKAGNCKDALIMNKDEEPEANYDLPKIYAEIDELIEGGEALLDANGWSALDAQEAIEDKYIPILDWLQKKNPQEFKKLADRITDLRNAWNLPLRLI